MGSKNSSGESYGKGRTRNYATVVYPESAPENWRTILSESKIPLFISPLHDGDANADGEKKKEHYHVMVMYDSVKTSEQAREFIDSFGGVGCEAINSVRSYARYLCHLDNPEKCQYDIDQVVAFGGADYIQAIGTMADKAKAIREMIAWIEENDCDYFCDLFNYSSINRSDWFDCLINSGTFPIKEYIKSRTFKKYRNLNVVPNPVGGVGGSQPSTDLNGGSSQNGIV